ncbi:MAG: Zn-ribbon domain-containing OB-fold protein, partial [Acidimicrobiales bacterium]
GGGGGGGGRGQAGLCGPDQDGLTLAWTAGTRALAAAGRTADEVDALFWGTSRPPFAEGPSHAILATALGLTESAGGVLASGSAHAGMEALTAAWDSVAAGSSRLGLVVVSDAVVPGLGTAAEGRCGAGAVALVLAAPGAGLGAPGRLSLRSTRYRPVLDRYRGDGERGLRDTYDARVFRDQIFLPIVADAVGEVAHGVDDCSWSLPDPDGRLGAALARRLGIGPKAAGVVVSGAAYDSLGDAAAAAALLGALPAMGGPGRVGVVGYGGGRSTVVMLDVEAAEGIPGAASAWASIRAPARAVSYSEALRSRGDLVAAGETVAMAIPPGSAAFVRGGPELLGLLGARCVDCGVISTPPSVHPACIVCGGAKLEAVPLARRGSVHTFVVNHTMPAPFVAPLPLVVVDLDDGARLMVQGLADDATALGIGDQVELVLRRYAVERGAPVYGFKAARLAPSPAAQDEVV